MGSAGLSELQAPLSDGLVGEENTTHRHDLFDVAVAQSEAVVKPHGVGDDLRGEANGGDTTKKACSSADYVVRFVVVHR